MWETQNVVNSKYKTLKIQETQKPKTPNLGIPKSRNSKSMREIQNRGDSISGKLKTSKLKIWQESWISMGEWRWKLIFLNSPSLPPSSPIESNVDLPASPTVKMFLQRGAVPQRGLRSTIEKLTIEIVDSTKPQSRSAVGPSLCWSWPAS